MITQNNILVHEMIGLHTKVLKSTNSQINGISGKIIDETKNMFILKTENGLRNIPKNHNKWFFSINEQKIILDGKLLAKRSQDRLVRKI